MTPLQAQLEADLVRAPDDLATHMAYGDYLAERGDPRGELIQVQLALEDPERTPEQRFDLHQREGELLDRHWRSLLGPLADYIADRHSLENRVTFRRGWIDSIRLGLLGIELAEALVHTPNLSLLRSVRLVDLIPHPPGTGFDPDLALIRLQSLSQLPNLRSLSIGDHEGDAGLRPFSDPEIGEFVHCFRQLEELNLNIVGAEPSLLSIQIPALRVLRLDRFRFGDTGVDWLLTAPFFTSLHTLQVWNGRLTDTGARALARHLHTRSLKLLDVSFNWLTSTGIDALESVCKNLRAEYQLTPETDVDFLAEQADPYGGDWE